MIEPNPRRERETSERLAVINARRAANAKDLRRMVAASTAWRLAQDADARLARELARMTDDELAAIVAAAYPESVNR